MSLVFLPVPAGAQTVQQVAIPAGLQHQPTLCLDAAVQNSVPQIVFSTAPPTAYESQPIIMATATKRNNEDSSRYYSGSIDNGAKKIKTDAFDAGDVSKVVHLRSLPVDVTETEVIQVGMTYGRVTNILMLKGKNQAFLEMEDEETASNMVASSEINPPTIRQRIIYVQFSNHKQLKTDTSPNQMRAQAVLQAMQQVEGGTNHVLRAVVENMLYPITIDVLHTIFSKFGVVLKIITFNKSNQFQALVQMGDAVQSQTAKLSLDGQNIYNGCCTLRIEFSRLDSLNVKFNNDKSRDFTRNDLPTGVETSLLGSATNQLPALLTNSSGLMPSPYANASALAAVLQQQSQLASLASAQDCAGDLFRQAAQSPFDFSLPAPSSVGANSIASMRNHASNILGNSASNQHYARGYSPGGMLASNSVLHVSNLNEDMVTSPDILFILFGVYGDVMRVKILFQKKSSALVQMNDGQQAQIVIKFLHGIRLFGRPLNICISKHTMVQLPKEGLDVENLTRDYSNSPLHRFKKPGSKNFQNIFPPSDVLHLSNIPGEVTEEFITEQFNQHGEVLQFKFFQKDRKMALIKMSSVDEALKCLVMLHNFKLTENNHLRVSFSKGHI